MERRAFRVNGFAVLAVVILLGAVLGVLGAQFARLPDGGAVGAGGRGSSVEYGPSAK